MYWIFRHAMVVNKIWVFDSDLLSPIASWRYLVTTFDLTKFSFEYSLRRPGSTFSSESSTLWAITYPLCLSILLTGAAHAHLSNLHSAACPSLVGQSSSNLARLCHTNSPSIGPRSTPKSIRTKAKPAVSRTLTYGCGPQTNTTSLEIRTVNVRLLPPTKPSYHVFR